MRFHQPFLYSVIALLTWSATATAQNLPASSSTNPNLHIAFVTNGFSPFWKIAIQGAKKAAKDRGVKLTVMQPDAGVRDQVRMLNNLFGQKVDGIGVSVIDPRSQLDLLNRIAKDSVLVLHDTDAPQSNRISFVGVDNYKMGRICGQLIKEAIPKGGEVAPFVGRLNLSIARQRWQGMVDELLDRKAKQKQNDDPTKTIKGENYTILAIQSDNFDRSKAIKLSMDTLTKHPNVKCMVGLFAYNAPACLSAIKKANKTATVKIVGFDDMKSTLQGIADGHIHGVVVQDPYKLGIETVRALVSAITKNNKGIPESGFIPIKPRIVRKNNVDAFKKQLNQVLKTGQRDTP